MLHIRDFPDDLHDDAKAEAAFNKEPLRALVIRAVGKERDLLRKKRQAKERGA